MNSGESSRFRDSFPEFAELIEKDLVPESPKLDLPMQLMLVDVIDFMREPFYVPENELFNFTQLKNRYYIIRHGKSTANEGGLVVSNPKMGVPGYGLCDVGKDQIERKARRFLLDLKNKKKQLANVIGVEAAEARYGNNQLTDQNSIVLTSDFKRAVETAGIFSAVAGLRAPRKVKSLRERFFGEFDMRQGNVYPEIWQRDARDYAQKIFGVESVAEVLKRSTQQVKVCESMFEDMNIFLVCHGDIGQILEAGFKKMDPSKHRSLQHLENAEIREMWINPLMP